MTGSTSRKGTPLDSLSFLKIIKPFKKSDDGEK